MDFQPKISVIFSQNPIGNYSSFPNQNQNHNRISHLLPKIAISAKKNAVLAEILPSFGLIFGQKFRHKLPEIANFGQNVLIQKKIAGLALVLVLI